MEEYTLVGVDGNAFFVMGYVVKSMRRERFSSDEIKSYKDKSMSGDYGNLLQVSCEYLDKCNERYEARSSEMEF